MARYRVRLVATTYETVEVEAESGSQARERAAEQLYDEVVEVDRSSWMSMSVEEA